MECNSINIVDKGTNSIFLIHNGSNSMFMITWESESIFMIKQDITKCSGYTREVMLRNITQGHYHRLHIRLTL